MKWHDVSIELSPSVTVWPGDRPLELAPAGRIAQGDSCNTSILTMSTHTGTHCDAPWHFEDDGKRLEQINHDVFFGTALLIEIDASVDLIVADDLPREKLPPRVLFKTRNSNYAPDGPFQEQYVGLDVSAAERLVNDGVRLVGIDYLSIAPHGDSAPTHHALLQHEVFVVEGLRLGGFPGGLYDFIVLPLPLAGVDGAPCRAFLGIRESRATEQAPAGGLTS